ncbi:MAG: molybdopterin converting factor subunit 1 [Alphaproteobacteria bacterium]
MKLLYFAWLKQKIGIGAEEVTLPDEVNDVAGVVAWLKTRGDNYATALKDDAIVRVAVNQTYAKPDTTVSNGDEVALFPPVTGG